MNSSNGTTTEASVSIEQYATDVVELWKFLFQRPTFR